MAVGHVPDDKRPGQILSAAWTNLAAKNINAMGLSRLPDSIIGAGGITQGPSIKTLPSLLAVEITGNDNTDKWKHSWRVLTLDSDNEPVARTATKFPFEGKTNIQWAQTTEKHEEIPSGTPVYITPIANASGNPVWLIITPPRIFIPVVVKESSDPDQRGSDDVANAAILYNVWEQCADTSSEDNALGTGIALPACERHLLTEYTPAPDDSVASAYWDCKTVPRELKLFELCELVTNRCCASTT